MANDFCAIRLNPEQDADIINMLEKAPSKTDFIKACIRVAKVHVLLKQIYEPETEDEYYIRKSMEV